jgi:hypothetical protein
VKCRGFSCCGVLNVANITHFSTISPTHELSVHKLSVQAL